MARVGVRLANPPVNTTARVTIELASRLGRAAISKKQQFGQMSNTAQVLRHEWVAFGTKAMESRWESIDKITQELEVGLSRANSQWKHGARQ